MNDGKATEIDLVSQEIHGGPYLVEIDGVKRPLTYKFAAVLVYQQRTGDSLFAKGAWAKVDLSNDPMRWLSCLWAGLHQRHPNGSWKSPLTFEELSDAIDFRNANEISIEMAKAVLAFMPAPEKKKDGSSPNAEAPGDPAPIGKRKTTPIPGSTGPSLASASTSPAKSS